MKKTEKNNFLATIYRIWMMRHVDVPDGVARRLEKHQASRARTQGATKQKTKHIPVIATVNRTSVHTTLLPAGGGRYRMHFNAELRKAANADAGDLVGVTLAFDPGSRDVNVPKDLAAALRGHRKARKALRKCPPGHRRQIVKWMDEAKGEAARKRRIARVIDIMLERAILGPDRK
jgi:hypothetical protein